MQRLYFGENLSTIAAYQETSILVHFRYVLGCLNWVLRLTKSAAV